MAFFEGVGKQIAKTSQSAAQKAKNMAETVKINGMISDEEKRINDAFFQIGRTYYDIYGANPEQLFIQLIDGINDSRTKIAVCEEQIKQLKGIDKCKKCGSEVPYNAPFCSSCGSPRNVVDQAHAVSTFCSQCGSSVAPDKAFCTVCGTKVRQSVTEPPAHIPELQYDLPQQAEPPVAGSGQAAQEVQSLLICPDCGKELAANSVFCLSCGARTGD